MLRHFILDEADTMLHMNFMEDIKEIVFNFDMPENVKRQTLMFRFVTVSLVGMFYYLWECFIICGNVFLYVGMFFYLWE